MTLDPATPVDHVAIGLAQLPSQWTGAANMRALFTIFLQRYNDLELAAQQVLTLRSIFTATGAALDILGKLVGVGRNGLSDTDFRRFVAAAIAVNNSEGTLEELVAITFLAAGITPSIAKIVITRSDVATVVVSIVGPSITDAVANITLTLLARAVDGGVRLQLQTEPSGTSAAFQFASTVYSQSTLASGATVIAGTYLGAGQPGAPTLASMFSPTGTLSVGSVGAGAQNVSYTGMSIVGNIITFTGVTAMATTYPVNTPILRTNGIPSGFGTSSDTNQPTLTAYGLTGTTGGALADIRG